ncbi:electron transport complex protein RnfC [Tahibacter aquaticus]|uniref:Ion-translocating oxidoreductase complex subunit C n=1 Tax=Tahibacter aquaticus TaxID=520092 RepID=A0A4R6Z9D2_9GAMM|nr:electron transport complex subunit RsxC [Tahibacter aquaticus]TDR48511.1 electron transport complex protein RnfC [Tahibacter aquaticus]
MSLLRIPGGLVLAVPAAAAPSDAVRHCPLPARLYLPLVQERGQALHCRVQVGQTVRRGEPLAHDGDTEATVVPAPTSGRIVAIEPLTLAHASALEVPTLVLQADGRDETALLPPLPDWAQRPPQELRRRLAQAGVVGLGGAAYPAAAKLGRAVSLLVLNGAECEPYIACDETLMRSRAAEVVAGAAILGHIVAAEDVVIALEERMTEAAAALQAVLAGQTQIRLQRVPTVYPQGGERQLVQTLCAREVPSGAYPADIGVLVHNVATAAAAWRAVVLGEALTSRLVSVGGRGVRQPGVFEVRTGTLIEHLIDSSGGYTEQAARLVLGGPLMGLALPHDRIALGRGANSVLVLGADDVRAQAAQTECIRCGECARACPVQLQPQELWRLLRQGETGQAAALGLRDCIECGCCAFVCPAQIGLVDEYRAAKSALAIAAEQRRRADHARQRHDARNQRLAREQAAKVARVASRREEIAQAQTATANAATAPEPAPAETAEAAPRSMDKSAVLAAIARGKAKRAAAPPPAPPPETES